MGLVAVRASAHITHDLFGESQSELLTAQMNDSYIGLFGLAERFSALCVCLL